MASCYLGQRGAGLTRQADLQSVVDVIHTQVLHQQQEDGEGVLGQVRGI